MSTGDEGETVILNPAYWLDHSPQLAQILRDRGAARGAHIADPTGVLAKPEARMVVYEAPYWSAHPAELANALRRGTDTEGRTTSAGGVGVASPGVERLTLTVEEAATMLGISRAFAYEAVGRGDIPHIRIGRRILIPRTLLDRLIDATGQSDGDTTQQH
jgi:excisionase family DNA binding protein